MVVPEIGGAPWLLSWHVPARASRGGPWRLLPRDGSRQSQGSGADLRKLQPVDMNSCCVPGGLCQFATNEWASTYFVV